MYLIVLMLFNNYKQAFGHVLSMRDRKFEIRIRVYYEQLKNMSNLDSHFFACVKLVAWVVFNAF
jgi:hypothetical protein